jgi:hypothetical protein
MVILHNSTVRKIRDSTDYSEKYLRMEITAKLLKSIHFAVCMLVCFNLFAQRLPAPKHNAIFTYRDISSQGKCKLDTIEFSTFRNANVAKIKTQVETKAQEIIEKQAAVPHLYLYKTKADYRMNVPVTLSDDKKRIISYPDPKDFRVVLNRLVLGKDYIPAKLHNGYLLDKRGIGKNAAFLKYTFKQYAKLKNFPKPEDLMKEILDDNPLTFYCDLGPAEGYKSAAKEINEHIDDNRLNAICK